MDPETVEDGSGELTDAILWASVHRKRYREVGRRAGDVFKEGYSEVVDLGK